jgi:hypothetical protein
MNTTCERCWREMRWDTTMPRVCKDCRLCGLGLHPEQIERFEERLEIATDVELGMRPVIVVGKKEIA